MNNFQHLRELAGNAAFAWIGVVVSTGCPLPLLLAVWVHWGLLPETGGSAAPNRIVMNHLGFDGKTGLGSRRAHPLPERMTLMERLDLSEPQCPCL